MVWEYLLRVKELLATQPVKEIEKLEDQEEGQVLRKLLSHTQFWQLLINADPNSQLDSDNLLESTDKRLQEIVLFQQLVEQSLQKMQKQNEKQ